MIECKYSYSYEFLNKINNNSTKKINIISEIASFIMLISAIILFITGNKILGIVFVGICCVLLLSVFLTRRFINNSNQMLLNQHIKLVFNEGYLTMETSRRDEVLYNAKFEYDGIKKLKQTKDMVYLYFDKVSCIVIPKTSFKNENDFNKMLELVQNNYVV